MRILMVSPHPTVSGPLPKHTPILLDALRDAGCEVESLPWGRHGDDDSLLQRAWSRIWDVRQIRARVRRGDFDVVVVRTSHEWTSLLRDLPLLIATRRPAERIVVQFHGGKGRSDRLQTRGSPLFKATSQLLFKLADGVLFLSSEEQARAARFYPEGRFRTVVNPYVPSQMQAAFASEPRPPALPTVLFVGRLIPEKGVLDTLEAFALLRARRECRLIVAGDGPAFGTLASRVAELGLADDIELTGRVGGGQLAELYKSAAVFVLPTYWAEGFPTAITEAMHAGLPVITTRLRGMADHLTAGENALFVSPRDPAGLAAELARLLDDDALRARMGAANVAKVEDFAPAAAARRYLEALREICADRRAA